MGRVLRILVEGEELDLSRGDIPLLAEVAPKVYRYIPPLKNFSSRGRSGKCRRLSREEIRELVRKGELGSP